MHRITPCSQKVMLRFRRWSRKEYAAFVMDCGDWELHGDGELQMLHWASRKRQCARERKQKACHGLTFQGKMHSLEVEDRGLEEVYSRQTGQNCGVCWCRKGKKCLHCF